MLCKRSSTKDDNDTGDSRPLLSSLLVEHSASIEFVRKRIEKSPGYEASIYDDIWILRFVLSHQRSNEKAIRAAIKTMIFRRDNKLNQLGDIRYKILDHQHSSNPDAFPVHKRYADYCKQKDAVMHTLQDTDRGVVTYILASKVDMNRIAKEMSKEEFRDLHIFLSEMIYQIQDEVTRRTGKLTKLLRIFDLKDMTFANLNFAYIKRDAVVEKTLQDYYPQLVGKIVMVNAPDWITVPFRAFRPLFPSRLVQKLDFVLENKNIPFSEKFIRYISKENLPVRYGGDNEIWPPPYAGGSFQNRGKTCTMTH